ncbi:MAG: DUF1405 domain-containing protein, partial [Anaerobacillus sp.]
MKESLLYNRVEFEERMTLFERCWTYSLVYLYAMLRQRSILLFLLVVN